MNRVFNNRGGIYRARDGVILGVCKGIANYFDFSLFWIRIGMVVIFLLSGNSAEARSIKPLLAFHYAGKLPVYSTSSIYNGRADPKNRDLDGINFAETPWLLDSNPDLRATIAAGAADSDTYTRLNALGADAFLLQVRFLQLQAGPDALVRGNTGLLSMDPSLQIRRELSLATFDGGAVKAQ